MTIAAVVVLAGGCLWFTWGKGYYQAMQPTITRRQAIDRVEQLIQQTVAQLSPDARLEPSYRSDEFPCDDPTDGGPKGRVIVGRDYWIRNLPRDQYPQYFDSVESDWKDRGHRLLRDTQRTRSRTLVYSDPDGFRIALETTGGGEYLIVSSHSPCIWPDGAPGAQ